MENSVSGSWPKPAVLQNGRLDASSCYGSMVASTSNATSTSERQDFIEAPAFFYDMDFDLRALKAALKTADFLEDSGYQSVLERSQSVRYGTGWMVADTMSEADDDSADDNWDGFMNVGADRIKVKDMSDILASRYCFISGARTDEGLSIVTFPDSRTCLSHDDYQLLITYLLQVPQMEDAHRGFVLIVDRRTDKWSAVRSVLLQIASFFPGSIRVVFLLKPEGVLQRALEVGYRGITEQCSFKVILCESSVELRRSLRPEQLTMDVGGLIKYNHLEWVQHRMDIERMKSSAAVIAQSLSEFGRSLRETELPNDAETTARILQIQTGEKDAIKEDFRISVRKGLSLLRSVRQLETKPRAEQLSPTRLHNVTAIERMLVQLEETERSFDAFWERHERRLMHCLQLRQFEDSFRKLQAAFARHMMYLEEHREVGDCAEKALLLADQLNEYTDQAMEDVTTARTLKEAGEELVSTNDVEGTGSLLPKCDELGRMADALTGALERRKAILLLSQQMHNQIAMANAWCKKGVDILSIVPLDISSSTVSLHIDKMDSLLQEGAGLQLDTLSQSPTMNKLILLTTTETSTLLAQVAERIDDIRRMSVARRDALMKVRETTNRPVQIVSPEKASNPIVKQEKKDVEVTQELTCFPEEGPSVRPQSPNSITVEHYVIAELLNTEKSYVAELESICDNYVDRFDASESQAQIAPPIRGRPDLVFGNIRDLLVFHSRCVLPDLLAAENSTSQICRAFLEHQNRFLMLYYSYCTNKSSSEAIRKEFADSTPFFQECQRRAGHPLPLGAYLLKPVQRITKYQLLLKELERHCRPEVRPDVEAALRAMLDLLNQINSAIQQLHIIGFTGDLRLMGPLRLQSECDVYAFNKKKGRRNSRAQRRHLFIFDGGLVICKKRNQQNSAEPDYYEYKNSIPTSNLYFCEQSKSTATRFEIMDESKGEGWAVETIEVGDRQKWIESLRRFTSSREECEQRQRPKSWTSTVSTDSSCSSRTSSDHSSESLMDTNGNTTPGAIAPHFSLDSPTQELEETRPKTHNIPIIEEPNTSDDAVVC